MTHRSSPRPFLRNPLLLATAGLCVAGLALAGPALAADAGEPGCCRTEAVAELGFGAAEPGPFLDFGPDAAVFRAAADLDAGSAQLLVLSNPSKQAPITVQVRSITDQGRSRALAVELAAGDRASFDLPAGASHLVITGHQPFRAEVESLLDGSVLVPDMAAARTGRNPRTNDLGFAGTQEKSTITKCQGQWTLTCIDAPGTGCDGLGPFTHYGEMEVETIQVGNRTFVFHWVYWNLNYPTGDYETENGDGLGATWSPGSGGCPDEVTNDLGHTYSVTR